MLRVDGRGESLGSQSPVIAGLAPEAFSTVHGQRSSAKAKADAFWPILPAVTLLTVKFRLMRTRIGGVQQLVAHSAFEAKLVPVISTGDHLLSSIN